MNKYKLFLSDIREEEDWINNIQAQGYRLTKRSNWLPRYTFEKTAEPPLLVRIDFKDYMSKDKFEDYKALFEDSGWQHLSGSNWGGLQYFQQSQANSDQDIFSDEASAKLMVKTFYNYAMTQVACNFCYLIVFSQTLYKNVNLLNPLTWFMAKDIWQMPGDLMWKAVLFELPFVLLRIFPFALWAFLSIYYWVRASNIKKKYQDIDKKDAEES